MSDDFTPLYVQLANTLRTRILDGTYALGDAIPSEPTLQREYRTTRGTIRNAIATLVNEGLVRQVRGRGTFVILRETQHTIRNFTGFTDSLRNTGETAVAKVVEESTHVADGVEYYRLVRVRGIRNEERVRYLSLDTSLLPLARFAGLPDHDFGTESLYQVLREEYDTHPARTDMVVKPHLPDDRTRELLDEPAETPALLEATGSAYDTGGEEIEQIQIIYASAVQFSLTTNIKDIPSAGTLRSQNPRAMTSPR